MHTIVEFDENNKWFVISEKEINNIKYSYMIRVNNTEDDFIDEYAVVRSVYKNGEEYMEVVNDNQDVLVVTEKGYGKKTPIGEYRITNRGGKGVKTLNITDKNGSIISFKTVDNDKDLMIITNEGIVIRLDVNQISTMSRVTQGVRLINLRDGQLVGSTAIIDKDEEVDNSEIESKEETSE